MVSFKVHSLVMMTLFQRSYHFRKYEMEPFLWNRLQLRRCIDNYVFSGLGMCPFKGYFLFWKQPKFVGSFQ